MFAFSALSLLVTAILGDFTSALPATPVAQRATAPTVTLDNGTFVGVTSSGVDSFLGIPFAEPPIGDLRYRLPVTIPPYNKSTHTVTSFGPACFQQKVVLPIVSGLTQDAIDYIANSIYGAVFPSAEDCLTINVWRPSTATATSKLPVVAWIFGGGFELGSPQMYSGAGIVERSVTMGSPVVFVSMNYRLSGIGFLASAEVKAAGVGNLGLQDQREALRWIQKYIGTFGGDPTKVTIQGESAGAISVGLQMVTNGGNNEGLFRGAFMQSGSPIPVGDITHGQVYYDDIVASVGCTAATDTLACLRTVSWAALSDAINATPMIFAYQSLNLAWLPRVDGIFLTEPPYNLVAAGQVSNVPFVTGDCDDEGTLFSLSNLNVTTDAEFSAYTKATYLPQGTAAQIAAIAAAYPSDITQGSPFDTGILNALTPQFKRLAAVQGDLVFQGPRRWFLQHRASLQNSWSFLYKRNKILPVLGTVHASDIINLFIESSDLVDYTVNFAVNLNPNGVTVGPTWPQWSNISSTGYTPQSLMFIDGLIPRVLTADTYRLDAMNLLNQLAYEYPI